MMKLNPAYRQAARNLAAQAHAKFEALPPGHPDSAWRWNLRQLWYELANQ